MALLKPGPWSHTEGARLAAIERETWQRHRPETIRNLRKARGLVEAGASSVRRALIDVGNKRDLYGAIAISAVVLERAAPRTSGFVDVDEWSRGRPTREVLAVFDRAIAALESSDGTL